MSNRVYATSKSKKLLNKINTALREVFGQGVGMSQLSFGSSLSKKPEDQGIQSVKITTTEDNEELDKVLKSFNFVRVGDVDNIRYIDRSSLDVADLLKYLSKRSTALKGVISYKDPYAPIVSEGVVTRGSHGSILEGLQEHREILEGLAKSDFITRNKSLLAGASSALEGIIRSNPTIKVRDNIFISGVVGKSTFRIHNSFKVETYQEGNYVVLGISMGYLEYEIKIDKDATHAQLKKYPTYFFEVHKEKIGEYTAEQMEMFKNDKGAFIQEFGRFLDELEVLINKPWEVTYGLKEKAYPSYKNRKMIPFLSIDFKKSPVEVKRAFSYKAERTTGSGSVSMVLDVDGSLKDFANIFRDEKKLPYGLFEYRAELQVSDGDNDWPALAYDMGWGLVPLTSNHKYRPGLEL